MDTNIILYLMMGMGVILLAIIVAFIFLRKNNKDRKYVQQLQQGTKSSKYTSEIIYQKLYVFYLKTPFLKRYILKLRRRLEIIHIDDEYQTRMQASKILTRAFFIILPLMIVIIALTNQNILLMFILLMFELFMLDTFIDGMVDKIDNKLLKEQVNFFSEIRHAYHETNMVEEAIYQTAQDDENPEMSRQAEKIYDVLISDDPEGNLEKYYDVAPNSYLKEFAGVSYLTREFGDRQVEGASLYLKNLNNITQEMQLEILKREKLDYTFQSLSVISIVPMLGLEPLKSWAISNFSFTEAFYSGKDGMIIQILVILVTFLCYILTRKLKDNGSVAQGAKNTENPWQAKLYNNPIVKKIVNLFIPKPGSKESRKLEKTMKDSASKDKIEWIFINRICLFVVTFFVSIILFNQLHQITIDNIYTNPTTTYDIIGEMSDKMKKTAMQLTESDNEYIKKFKSDSNITQSKLQTIMKKGKPTAPNNDYKTAKDTEIEVAAERIIGKIGVVNSETLQWFEVLMGVVFAMAAYMMPVWMLIFQKRMRQMEMEDEVMQFQTIILMLMRIERVNVEIILEWLERYANIFREPLSRCINNYESGPWEALEAMKDDVTYQDFIRIIESLQAAVEKIPIKDAFDELDTERDYYQSKRKESNERLISKKGMIGKGIGFAPMIVLFVGYLIVPLVFIGLTSMTSSFSSMGSM